MSMSRRMSAGDALISMSRRMRLERGDLVQGRRLFPWALPDRINRREREREGERERGREGGKERERVLPEIGPPRPIRLTPRPHQE